MGAPDRNPRLPPSSVDLRHPNLLVPTYVVRVGRDLVNSLTDTAALQAATVLWWVFVGTLSLAALGIIGVNLRMWRGE